MANRFQKNQHRLAWLFISERDGEYCLICHKTAKQAKLQIDHADNNPENWEPANLHLLCQKHNLQLRVVTLREKLDTIKKYSATNVCVRARFFANPSTKIIQSTTTYTDGSPEMQVNAQAELKWREWILTCIREKGYILRETAIWTGAELFGVSGTTIERYLRKLTHPESDYIQEKDAFGVKIIKLRTLNNG